MSGIYQRINEEPTGLAKAAAVFVLGAALSLVLWYPLGVPSEFVRNVIAQPTVICNFGSGPNAFFAASAAAGTPRMYVCSFGVAVLTMAGPIALLFLAFMFRKVLRRLVASGATRLPQPVRPLVGPLLATARESHDRADRKAARVDVARGPSSPGS